MISIIVPYQHSRGRLPIAKACLQQLLRALRGLDKPFEVCIFECGPTKKLDIAEKSWIYSYVQTDNGFNRAWAFNAAVQNVASGDRLLLMDCDLLVSKKWLRGISRCHIPVVPWNRLVCLSKAGTELYVNRRVLNTQMRDRVKTPSLLGSAGGATLIPRQVFDEVGGIPENFGSSWGGEDNAFWSKLKAYGVPFKTLPFTIFHLWHPRRAHGGNRDKVHQMIRWTKSEWDSDTAKRKVYGTIDKSLSVSRQDKPKKKGRAEWKAWPCKKPAHYWFKIHPKETEVIPKGGIRQGLPKLWQGFDRQILNRILDSKDPMVTIVIPSYLRVKRVVELLKWIEIAIEVKINLILKIQGPVGIDQKSHLDRLCKNVAVRYRIDYYKQPLGPVRPKAEGSYEAATKWGTPYVMTLDDDIFFPRGGIEAEIITLERFKDIGALTIWYNRRAVSWHLVEYHGHPALFEREPEPPLDHAEVLGSATMIVRSKVFKSCRYDKTYKQGWSDFDFSLQMREAGWNVAILMVPRLRAFHDVQSDSKEYFKARWNKAEIAKSESYFLKKWGVVIGIPRLLRKIKKRPNVAKVPPTNIKLNIVKRDVQDARPNRGPRIQARNKIRYFPKFFGRVNIDARFTPKDLHKKPDWTHWGICSKLGRARLEAPRTSFGPGITGSPKLIISKPRYARDTFKGKFIVADSFYARNAMFEIYNMTPKRVFVIPVIIAEEFYYATPQQTDIFTVGMVGYCEDFGRVKNIKHLPTIAKRFPNWRFELCVNRSKDDVFTSLKECSNIVIHSGTLANLDMPKIYSKWSCYLGISKMERGPAVLSECKAVGIPTLCSNHTGYKEFKPLIPMDIKPFRDLTASNVDLVCDGLKYIHDNQDVLRGISLTQKERFWSTRNPKIIVRLWKEFFYECCKKGKV